MLATAALILVTVTIGAAVAGNAATGGPDVIYACAKKSNGRLRIVDKCDACGSTESCLFWNVTGPAGPPGEPGPPGPPGLQAAAGLAGPQGPTDDDDDEECECDITRAEFDALVATVTALEAYIFDQDGDGYPVDVDCDDTDPDINPGATEVCDDGVDNDCNNLIDCDDAACLVDTDGDGYMDVPCGDDCGPADPNTYPGADELCDGVDNDCDGLVDEDFDFDSDPQNCGACGHVCELPHAVAKCEGGTCLVAACDEGYADCDGDPANGCEVALGEGGGTCEAAQDLGSPCGDGDSLRVMSMSGVGQRWVSIELRECDTEWIADPLVAQVILESPSDADYDLYVYAPCGTPIGSSSSAGGTDIVDVQIDDESGVDDTIRLYVEVRWAGGSSCEAWDLDFVIGSPTTR